MTPEKIQLLTPEQKRVEIARRAGFRSIETCWLKHGTDFWCMGIGPRDRDFPSEVPRYQEDRAAMLSAVEHFLSAETRAKLPDLDSISTAELADLFLSHWDEEGYGKYLEEVSSKPAAGC